MSLLSRGSAFLASRLQTTGGVTITYSRPATSDTATITANVGQQSANLVIPGEAPARLEPTERDYLIVAADLSFGPPKKHDRIVEAGVGTFEVLPRQDQKEWRWSDTSRTVYRVHVKQV